MPSPAGRIEAHGRSGGADAGDRGTFAPDAGAGHAADAGATEYAERAPRTDVRRRRTPAPSAGEEPPLTKAPAKKALDQARPPTKKAPTRDRRRPRDAGRQGRRRTREPTRVAGRQAAGAGADRADGTLGTARRTSDGPGGDAAAQPLGSVLSAAPYPCEAIARTYEVRTYGCQMNVHDSERLSGLLEDAGYAAAPEPASRPTSSCSTPARCARTPTTSSTATSATSRR